jgi:hypothetical protein
MIANIECGANHSASRSTTFGQLMGIRSHDHSLQHEGYREYPWRIGVSGWMNSARISICKMIISSVKILAMAYCVALERGWRQDLHALLLDYVCGLLCVSGSLMRGV